MTADRLAINKNFANYPLSRDARQKVDWRFDPAEREHYARLPTESEIELVLPADVPERLKRAPTALDMNLVFQLLSEVQRVNGNVAEFPSAAELLRRVGLTAHSANHASLEDALAYLREIVLRIFCWYEPRGKTIRQRLPPPIVEVARHGNRIAITVAPKWTALALAFKSGYFAPIPLPLPNTAAAQNLALLVLTWPLNRAEPTVRRRRLRTLAAKCGIDHSLLSRTFAEAARIAGEWFAEHGGELDMELLPKGKVLIGARLPKVPRKTRRSRADDPPQTRRSRSAGDPQTRRSLRYRSKDEEDNCRSTDRYEAADAAGSRFARRTGTDGPAPYTDIIIHHDPDADAQD